MVSGTGLRIELFSALSAEFSWRTLRFKGRREMPQRTPRQAANCSPAMPFRLTQSPYPHLVLRHVFSWAILRDAAVRDSPAASGRIAFAVCGLSQQFAGLSLSAAPRSSGT